MNGMAVFEQETSVCVRVRVVTCWFYQGTKDHNVQPDMWWVADSGGSKVWVGSGWGTEIVGARGN